MNDTDRAILAAEVGSLIRRAREGAGLSVSRAANILNVSRQWLARVEGGETIPNLARLVQIADAFHVAPGALIAPPRPEDIEDPEP